MCAMQIDNLKNAPNEELEVGAPPAEPSASPEGKPHHSFVKFKIGNEAEMRNRLEVQLRKTDTACEGITAVRLRKLYKAECQGSGAGSMQQAGRLFRGVLLVAEERRRIGAAGEQIRHGPTAPINHQGRHARDSGSA